MVFFSDIFFIVLLLYCLIFPGDRIYGYLCKGDESEEYSHNCSSEYDSQLV